ncbi:MAG TPA: serine/threonine-protein kinase [Xanthomonadaceae bacterium]|nr:serine/threonine-protein kinase [Xanthomonadaceae bacterium]
MSHRDPHYARVKALFQDALERPSGDRRSFLDQACDDEQALIDEVWSLLQAAEADSTGFLLRPPAPSPPLDPATLGLERGWRVIRELARGGMGVVYLAERGDGAYVQQVALKLLQPSILPDQESILRLKLERQILARLNHPHIARLLDGGTTVTGMPYLVMEYVEGERLDTWCDTHALSVKARVELFIKVCEAVAYAHRNQVVHRDLKPGNVLVGADGEPKLLDFGIARWLEEDSSLTADGGRLLTPRFASPEQIRGETVTTQSDVYSLGVVLYELLSGRSPYGEAVSQPHRLPQAICETEPEPPSTRSGRGEAEGVDVDALRHRGRRMRGDLDAIVLRCLRKSPALRYASVDDLVADLRAHLEGRPVTARQGHRFYHARVFARRHWAALATAAGVLLLVAAFVFGLVGQLEETRLERDKNARTLAFVTDLFRVADPSEARGSSVTVREALDRGAALLRGDEGLQAPVRGRLLLTIGTVYRQLGLLELADSTLSQALDAGGTDHDRITASLALSGVRTDQGRFDDAAALIDAADVALHRVDDRQLRGRLLHQRGELALRQARFAEAEAPLRQALALRESVHGAGSREAAETHTLLGNVARDRGRLDEAHAHYRTALDAYTRLGEDPWNRAKLVNNLAIVAADRGDIHAAEARFREALDLMRSAVGEDHPLIAAGLGNVASMMTRRGDYAGAEPLLVRALQIRKAALGEDHPLTATALANLGYLRFAGGRFEEAAADLNQALAVQQAAVGLAHPHALSTMRNLAAVEFARGDLAAAVRWNLVQIEVASAALGAEHPLLLQAAVRLAFLHCLADDCSLDTLIASADAHRARLGSSHAEAGESLAHAALAAWWSNDPRSCALAADAQAALAPTLGEEHWDRTASGLVTAACDGSDSTHIHARLASRYGDHHPLLLRLPARADAAVR